jgi:hypothetical protein
MVAQVEMAVVAEQVAEAETEVMADRVAVEVQVATAAGLWKYRARILYLSLRQIDFKLFPAKVELAVTAGMAAVAAMAVVNIMVRAVYLTQETREHRTHPVEPLLVVTAAKLVMILG